MLREYRCRRYATRLKELVRCTPVDPLLVTEGEVASLASRYADTTCPTPAECLIQKERAAVCLFSQLQPAPKTLWEEDAALLMILLDHFNVRPNMEIGLALYTATLCRSAGLSALTEPSHLEREILPQGASLGDLIVRFVFGE